MNRNSIDSYRNTIGDGAPTTGCTLKRRGLSEDESSENALLRSRIDEQSELIMILKRRSDDAVRTAESLDQRNSSLVAECEQAREDLKMHMRRCDMLEARFNDLASNHQQMIEFKDEYKQRNVELEEDNERLRCENSRLFSAAINERDARIGELETSEQDLKQQMSLLDAKCRMFQHRIDELTVSHQSELEVINKQLKASQLALEETKKQLEQLSSKTSQASEDAQAAIDKLTKEKEDLLQLTMSRGRLVQEKQTENKALHLRLENSEKQMKDMKAKFERNAAAVNVSAEVQRLRACLSDAQNNYDSLTQDYDMYKKHSQTLLQQEKELNERLRHLVT